MSASKNRKTARKNWSGASRQKLAPEERELVMDEKETRQYVRDQSTANEAVRDQRDNEYHSRISMLNPFPSDEKVHDDKVYNAAYAQSREQSKYKK